MTQLNSTSIIGENFPAWLALVFALLGIAGCIYTAQNLVPNDLESKVFIPRFIEPNKKGEDNPSALSSSQNTKKMDEPIRVNNHESAIIENIHSPDILSTFDCPPLFTFTFEKNNIAPYSLKRPQLIVELKEWLDIHPEATIVLEGYSSSKGPSESNLILSYRRFKCG